MADYASVAGDTITITPTSDTYYGEHELEIVAYYSASTFESPVPTTPILTKTIDVIVQRNAGIEEWPLITITALGALLIGQAVIVTYLFCDKIREEEFISVQPTQFQFPQADKTSRDTARVNLIKLA